MKNPLSKEQIKKIEEIAKLPLKEQQIELQKFLKTLTPEQVEFLKKQQGSGTQEQQCPFCGIVDGRIAAKIVYEDNKVIAVLDINPASSGHTLVIPKRHFNNILEMDDESFSDVFSIASKIGKEIVKNLNAEGLNVFAAYGEIAGQRANHVLVHLIPRYKGDGIDLNWEGKKISEKEMSNVYNLLKSKIRKEEEVEREKIEEIKDYEIAERIP